MISVDEAKAIVARHPLILGSDRITIPDAITRTLAEDILSDRPLPPYDRVMMDGIAIRAADIEASRSLALEGIQAAGQPAMTLSPGRNAIEIMTGAVLPIESDTVIRYEDLDISMGVVNIAKDVKVKKGQNIHRAGTDRKAGATLIPTGKVISAAEIGILATVGKEEIKVISLPQITIISTGDELVKINQQPLPHQIRRSNSHQLQSLLQSRNIPSKTMHIPDDLDTIKSTLAELLETQDAIILSGGVSMGKFDFLPQALTELGVSQHFHKIAQRPGKPMWFGTSEKHKCTVFALPGNPVSTFNCCIKYVLPWINNGLGRSVEAQHAALDQDFSFKPSLTYFLQVKTQWVGAVLTAKPVTGKGSGDLANLVNADGFLELPSDRNDFQKGETFPFHSFR